jgi:UDP-N-acetylglucosamine--N-acetylmuramyl-(pentapeptide) pyrophosphoryl-undecaprenol N-acetylglucosamine transferase
MEAGLVQRANIPFRTIPSGQIAGMGLRTLPNLLKVLRGMIASSRILKEFKPDVLLFTGGYVAVPMALAGSGLVGGHKVPSLVYTPDIEPGLALKLLARFASLLALTTEDARQFFSPKKPMVVTGYPTRPELLDWTRVKAFEHLGLQADRFTLLVTGGSTGARSINRALLAVLPELLQEMQIIHISGQLDWAEVEAAQKQLPAEQAKNYHAYSYLHEMGAALAAADLVISRAGASTLGEYPLFGLPAILVPYPHAWRYQKVNAAYLVDHNAALMIEDAQLPDQILSIVQKLSHDPDRLQRMRVAMQSLAHPQSAQHLASLVRRLAGTPASKRDMAVLPPSTDLPPSRQPQKPREK